MITSTTSSGNINILHLDNYDYIIYLDNYEGELELQGTVNTIRFVTHGECKINSDIVLPKINKLDSILISGEGTCQFTTINATVVTIKSLDTRDIEIKADSIVSNITKISNCNLTHLGNSDIFLNSEGHLTLVDSIIECADITTAFKCPYILIDNCDLNIINCTNIIDSSNEACVVTHCIEDTQSNTSWIVKAKVRGSNDEPMNFQQAKLDNEILTRRKIYTHEPAYTPLNEYDEYREKLGYTNPDLHRRIDQEGEYEYPELFSPKYEIGIRGIYSYRGTEHFYHDESSTTCEIP